MKVRVLKVSGRGQILEGVEPASTVAEVKVFFYDYSFSSIFFGSLLAFLTRTWFLLKPKLNPPNCN
jgi:hypothetical protein